MKVFTYRHDIWYWNPFWGFFVRPCSKKFSKEKIVKEGKLFDRLYDFAGQP